MTARGDRERVELGLITGMQGETAAEGMYASAGRERMDANLYLKP